MLNKQLITTDPRLKNGDLFFELIKSESMKKLHKKTDQEKRKSDSNPVKVKRSTKATGVNENHTSSFPATPEGEIQVTKGNSALPKRNSFADEIGTDISNPNKVSR